MKKTLQALPFKKLFYVLLIVAPLVLLHSCGNNKKKTPAGTALSAADDSSGNGASDCITMTRNQVKTWLNSGWSIQGNENYVPDLYFNPSDSNATMRVDGYPTNADTTVLYGQKIPFTIKSMDPPCSFPAGLALHPQYYNFAQQGFADGSGNLIPFDYMRLIPRAYTGDSTLLCFDVQIVYRGAVTAKGSTDPCPPFCP